MKTNLVVSAASFLLLIASSTVTFAGVIDHFLCRSANVRAATWTDDLKLFTFDDKGILVGQQENSALHSMNAQCIGIVKRVKGEKDSTANGYCNYQDKDGDTVALQWSHTPSTPREWIFISGTGKWKGITGGGAYNTRETGVRTKAQTKGTFQNCVHVTGTYELPKK